MMKLIGAKMHNLGKVLHFEIVRTLKKPTFWITTLAMPILVAVIFLLVFVSNKAGSDQIDKLSNETVGSVVVMDETGYITPDFAEAANLQIVNDKETGIKDVRDGKDDMFVYYPANPVTNKIEVYGKDDGLFGNTKYENQATNILKSAVASSVGNEKTVALLMSPTYNTIMTTYENGKIAKGIERYVAPLIFLGILYLVILLLSNQMLTSTTEEKENRVTEIILTTIQPRALILGKILALLMLGFLQIIIIALPVLITWFVFRNNLSSMIPSNIDVSSLTAMTPEQFIIGLGFLVGGLLLFTGVLVGIGAAVPTAKDANSYFGVVTIAMFAPLWTIMLILTDPNQLIVQIFSYFPLSAPITMMIRNAFDALPLWSAILGLVIVYATAALVLWLAARIFRYGTLEYSRRLSFKEIFSKKARA